MFKFGKGPVLTGDGMCRQVATDTRLWLYGALQDTRGYLADLIKTAIDRAVLDVDVIMPGFTHLQACSRHMHARSPQSPLCLEEHPSQNSTCLQLSAWLQALLSSHFPASFHREYLSSKWLCLSSRIGHPPLLCILQNHCVTTCLEMCAHLSGYIL